MDNIWPLTLNIILMVKKLLIEQCALEFLIQKMEELVGQIIYVRFYQFMYGFYPRDEVWRVNLSYIMLAVAVVPLLFDKFPFRKHFLKFTYVFPVIAFFF